VKEFLELPAEVDGRLWFHHNEGVAYAMHHHAELEFNLVTRGTGTYLLKDRKYQLNKHALVWLFPEQEHVLLHQSPDFEMWIAVFKPELVARVCTVESDRVLLDPDPPGHYCRRLPDAQTARRHDLYQQVLDAHDQANLFNAGLAYVLLATWRGYLEAEDIPAGDDIHPAVEKAARLIRDETDAASLTDLAQRAGLSPSRLSRLFKQQTGVSLVDFRNRKRIERFLALYGGGQRKTMLAAALEAGFGSYPQFHRVFRQVMGCSPAEYRRRR